MRVPGHQSKSNPWRWTVALTALAVLSVTLVAALVATPAERAHATTYSVNVTTDGADFNIGDGICDSDNVTSGSQCSLRAAIQEANFSSGVTDTINFSISGTGAHTIIPAIDLPIITDYFLTINGGTQIIVIRGLHAKLEVNADNVTISHLILDGDALAANGIVVDAANDITHVTSVEVKNFTAVGILFNANDDEFIVDTANVHDNGLGVALATDCDDGIIRNSDIQDNNTDGILLSDGSDNQVLNNHVEDNGSAPGDNGIQATDQSQLTISGNTIGDNFDNQILIAGPSTGLVTIKNNAIVAGSDGIELDATCTTCDDVHISGTTATEANCFSGSLGANEYYLENKTGVSVNAQFNYWAGDTDPTDKICASNQTNLNCETGAAPPPPPAGSNVDWDPVAASCAGPVTPTPTATPTGSVTPTPTGTPPTATATPTATGTPPTSTPTRTPTTVAMESVTLVGGVCNPVASTYPDDTPIDTIADGVSPEGILISIWKFDTATGMWRGFSPQFPQANDLSDVDRLDAIFICVSSAGTWLRPLI